MHAIPEKGKQNADVVEHQHQSSCTAADTAPPSPVHTRAALCEVVFSGFREEDEVGPEVGEDRDDATACDILGADIGGNGSALGVYKRLAVSVPGVEVGAALSNATTTVLVARRGFTKKRLHAARQGIPVLLPQWVETGCPGAQSLQLHTIDATTHPSNRKVIDSLLEKYAVPWLHGYVFSTTGMTTSEKAAIENICSSHGAVVEPSLTYKCDVLLTSTECVRALQRLRTTHIGGDNARDGGNGRSRHGGPTCSGLNEVEGAAGPGGCSSPTWLSAKVRFALEFDMPLVDHVKFFAMLRLDRLPPPTWWGNGSSTAAASEKAERRLRSGDAGCGGSHHRRYDDALDGLDLEAVVEACRVGAPPNSAGVGWSHILSTLDASASSSVRIGEQPGEDCEKEAEPRAKSVGDSVSASDSSSSKSASASTLSDPDAWEDFLSCALTSTAEAQPQRMSAYPVASSEAILTTRPHPAHSKQNLLSLNTEDVEVLVDSAHEPSTAHVDAADYFSCTARGDVPSLISRPSHCAGEAKWVVRGDEGLENMHQVDLSPRLTTTTLMQSDPAGTSGKGQAPVIKRARHRSEDAAATAIDHTTAYYALHRRFREEPGMPLQKEGVRGGLEGVAQPGPDTLSEWGSVALLGEASCLTGVSQTLVESGGGGFPEPSTVEQGAHSTAPTGAIRQPPFSPAVSPPTTSLHSRSLLPLFAMHPPFLSVCLLGCNEMEMRRAVRWCEQCRMLRLPVPTSSTDVVVLGSRVLTKRRYNTRTAATVARSAPTLRGGRRKEGATEDVGRQRNDNATRLSQYAAAPSGARGGGSEVSGVVVSVRYWAMDAAVAQALTEECGIPLSRLAPLKWLEDAAGKAEEAARSLLQRVGATGSTESLSGCGAGDATHGFDSETEMASASTPPDTLASVIQERLAEAQASAARMQSLSRTRGEEAFQQRFYPLPPLSIEQLPNLTDIRYYIRLRRSAVVLPAGTTTATSVAVVASPGSFARASTQLRDPAPPASSATFSASALEWQRLQGDVSEGSLRNHESHTIRPDCMRLANTTNPILPVVPARAATTADAQSLRDSPDTLAMELTTAERRFHQLVAILSVSSLDGGLEGGSTARTDVRAPGLEAAAAVSSKATTTAAESLQHAALKSCFFCCIENDFARVDWAVMRGLIRYGGGYVEKKTEAEWQKLQRSLTKRRGERDESLQPQPQVSLAHALHRSAEYRKWRQRLERQVRRWRGSTMGAAAKPNADGGSPAEKDRVRPSTDHSHDTSEIETLVVRVARAAEVYAQSPILRLLPHSFQRPPVTGEAAGEKPTEGGQTSPRGDRFHDVRRLQAVTMDYLLACLAVGRCVSPLSFFLFSQSIPSAPDMRLFHHQHQRRGTGGSIATDAASPQNGKRRLVGEQRTRAGTEGVDEVADAHQKRKERPALSAWLLERRYSKADSVGVCITPLWKLPLPSDGVADERCASAETATPVKTSVPSVVTPPEGAVLDPSLVPLLRVLMLGLRNTAQSLGGHLAETFSATAVTHVVVVDVSRIVQSSLHQFCQSEASEQPNVAHSADENEALCMYWPRECISDMTRCAAHDELCIVPLEWLETCVRWGTFVEEAAYASPMEISSLVEAQRQQRRRASQSALTGKARQESLLVRRQTSSKELPSHKGHPSFTEEARRKRARSPLCSSFATSPAPHTPPPPYRGSSQQNPSAFDEIDAPRPKVRLVDSSRVCADVEGTEPCTPPIRAQTVQHRQTNPFWSQEQMHQARSPAPLPLCVRSPTGSASVRCPPKLRADSHSIHLGVSQGPLHRVRRSQSASQHNTRSSVEQLDAEAYVEHLGNLFSFSPPRSTPLRSSVWQRRQSSTAAYSERVGSGPPQRESPPLNHMKFSLLHPHSLDSNSRHGAPGTGKGEDCNSASSIAPLVKSPAATRRESSIDPAAVSDHSFSTPRRRTLRESVTVGTTAEAASFSPLGTCSPRKSPDRLCRCTPQKAARVHHSLELSPQRTFAPQDGNMPQEERHEGHEQRSPCPNKQQERYSQQQQHCSAHGLLGGSTILSRDTATRAKSGDLRYLPGEARVEEMAMAAHVHDAEGSGNKAEEVWLTRSPFKIAPSDPVQGDTTPLCYDVSHDRSCESVDVAGADGQTTQALSWASEVVPDAWVEEAPHACDVYRTRSVVQPPAPYAAEDTRVDVLVPATFIDTPDGMSPCVWVSGAGADLDGRTSGDGEGGSLCCRETPPTDCRGLVRDSHSTAIATTLPPIPVPRERSSFCEALPPQNPPPYGGDSPLLTGGHTSRRSSPSPLSSARTEVAAAVVDVEDVAGSKEGAPGARFSHKRNTTGGCTAALIWPTHRPLSLSRRPSHSPVPPSPPPAQAAAKAFLANPSSCHSPDLPCQSGILHIYVLHDVPERAARVLRCQKAAETLLRARGKEMMPVLLQHASAHSTHQVAREMIRGDRENSGDPLLREGLQQPRITPPILFVGRCENANVLVTHEVNLRESVLVAIVRGCWVVQPGFLECVAAVLEGIGGAKIAPRGDGAASAPSLPFVSFHSADVTATRPEHAAAFVLCRARLRGALPTYEWTEEVRPQSLPGEGPKLAPIQRALLRQCRRQRQAQEASRGGAEMTRSHPCRGVFHGVVCLLVTASRHPALPKSCSAPVREPRGAVCTGGGSYESTERLQALTRVMEAGEGRVLGYVEVGRRVVSAAGGDERENCLFGGASLSSPHTGPFPSELPLLRCCRLWWRGPRICGEAAACPVAKLEQCLDVSDAALYQDLLWLLCSVFSQSSPPCEVNGDRVDALRPLQAARTSLDVSPLPCAQAQRAKSDNEKTITVLLDRSQLISQGPSDNALVVRVVPISQGAKEQGDAVVLSQSGRKGEVALDTADGTPHASLDCNVGDWLCSWLSTFDDMECRTGEESGGKSSRCYAPRAAWAMRAHLAECCATARDSQLCFDDAQPDGSTAQSSTSGEHRWKYDIDDIPFPVPCVEAVRRVCSRSFVPGSHTDTISSTITGRNSDGSSALKHKTGSHVIEFRSTGWIGASVAAGSSDELASSHEATCDTTDTAWLRECDRHTLWATLGPF